MNLENELALAIDKGQMTVEYQPQINLKTRQLCGVEALLRWDHPTRGRISPSRFIPLAEDSGMMGTIGSWALKEACSKAAQWHRDGLQLPLSANLSAGQLKQSNFVESVQSILTDSTLDSKYLCCEISESTAMHDTQYTSKVLNGLSEIGVKIAIDDFGTGYSSMPYLSDMPIDRLKIDKRFVDDLALNDSARTVIDAIVGLGNGLGYEIIAEGVECQQQNELLSNAGCDIAQGFFHAQPMSAEAIYRFAQTYAIDNDGTVVPFTNQNKNVR